MLRHTVSKARPGRLEASRWPAPHKSRTEMEQGLRPPCTFYAAVPNVIDRQPLLPAISILAKRVVDRMLGTIFRQQAEGMKKGGCSASIRSPTAGTPLRSRRAAVWDTSMTRRRFRGSTTGGDQGLLQETGRGPSPRWTHSRPAVWRYICFSSAAESIGQGDGSSSPLYSAVPGNPGRTASGTGPGDAVSI